MDDEILFSDIYTRLYDKLLNDILTEPDKKEETHLHKIEFFNMPKHTDLSSSSILIETDSYLMDILESYQFEEKRILNQFNLDLPRCTVLVDSEHITSYEQFSSLLKWTKNIMFEFNKWKSNLFTVLLLLCNQSSYCFPYVFLHNNFADIDKKIMIASMSEDRYIKINTHPMLTVSIEGKFGVMDLNEFIRLSEKSIVLLIETTVMNNIPRSKGLFSKYCVLTVTSQDI